LSTVSRGAFQSVDVELAHLQQSLSSLRQLVFVD
jgi:hypothetical protein